MPGERVPPARCFPASSLSTARSRCLPELAGCSAGASTRGAGGDATLITRTRWPAHPQRTATRRMGRPSGSPMGW
jgi:hypothetical protein